MLNRPKITLSTDVSENDLHTFRAKRKISGGTMSLDGRICAILSFMKTCRKLRLSFYHFLGDRLEIAGKTIAPLATLVLARG